MFKHKHSHDDRHGEDRRREMRGEGRGRDGHERGFGGGGRRGREGGRLFDHGDLRLVVMALLAEKPRYGYDLIKELEERVGGGYSPSPGVIYPTLTLLQEVGHASVSEEHGGRRLFTLTDDGRAYLDANRAAADGILARVAGSAADRAGPPPQVARALENLHVAVRLRLKGRAATDAQIRAVADAIDAAARVVEDI